MPKYFTYKHQVKLASGQKLMFAAGRGYYASPYRSINSIPKAPRGMIGGPDDMPSGTKAVFYNLTKKK